LFSITEGVFAGDVDGIVVIGIDTGIVDGIVVIGIVTGIVADAVK
jgi:hypothetical protein